MNDGLTICMGQPTVASSNYAGDDFIQDCIGARRADAEKPIDTTNDILNQGVADTFQRELFSALRTRGLFAVLEEMPPADPSDPSLHSVRAS